MNCEEFEIVGLGLERERAEDAQAAVERRAAIEHTLTCPRCAALQESWREAQQQLGALRDATEGAAAPLRVEMRLRQEFQTRHRTLKVRATAVIVAWALAGAAALVGGVSWWNWHVGQTAGMARTDVNTSSAPSNAGAASVASNTGSDENSASGASNGTTLIADNDAEDFTLLPGSMSQETGDASVVRVRMQRGALGTLGLPVNETRANEWIQVDLFVGQDGQPQAVRLPRE